ncbi:hypothetical protein BSG18_18020 [Pseudomonas ogarae]|nr:hypothetical protein BSG18_18020 [Pseudomonas ogarae]
MPQRLLLIRVSDIFQVVDPRARHEPAVRVDHTDVKHQGRWQQGPLLEPTQGIGFALSLVGVFDQLEGLIDFVNGAQHLRFVGGADFQARLGDALLRAGLFELDQVQGARPDDRQQQNGQQREQNVGFLDLVEAAPKPIARRIGQGVFTRGDILGRRQYTRPLDRHGVLPALFTADGLRVSDAVTLRGVRGSWSPALKDSEPAENYRPQTAPATANRHADRGFAVIVMTKCS